MNMTAAAATANTGTARSRASSECSRIWRMTRRMRLALTRYVVMLLMPSACLRALVRGVGMRLGVRQAVEERTTPSGAVLAPLVLTAGYGEV